MVVQIDRTTNPIATKMAIFLPLFFSSPSINSVILTSNSSLNFFKSSISGTPRPFSHLETDWAVTLNLSAFF